MRFLPFLKRRWRLTLTLAALAVAVGLAVRWRWFPGQAFDPVAWQDEVRVEEGVRLEMADRLVARRTLRGQTRAEVVGLLGDPTKERDWPGWDMRYWLGPERSYFPIDSEWLVIRFGADGRVEDYAIIPD